MRIVSYLKFAKYSSQDSEARGKIMLIITKKDIGKMFIHQNTCTRFGYRQLTMSKCLQITFWHDFMCVLITVC